MNVRAAYLAATNHEHMLALDLPGEDQAATALNFWILDLGHSSALWGKDHECWLMTPNSIQLPMQLRDNAIRKRKSAW